MKKLFGKLSLFIPVVLLVVSLNYFMDPACLFKDEEYLLGIADLLLSGHNVGNVSNYDERLLQKYYIDRSKKAKDVIVLGSSRSLQIGQDLFPGKDFFNHGVSGATIEDLMAIYYMYDKKEMTPKLIVLGVDPWIFNKNNGENRWKSVREDYYRGLKKQKLFALNFARNINVIPEKILQLFSFSYFQNSLDRLFSTCKGNRSFQYSSTQQREADTDILLADGSRSVSKEDRLKTEQQTLGSAQAYIQQNPVYHLGSFKEMDKYSIKEFESFIRFVKSAGSEIIIFLPPYNPFVYDYLIQTDQYKIICSVEAYIREFAMKEKVEIKGSYNPHPYAFTQRDFFDGMHPRRESFGKFFNSN